MRGAPARHQLAAEPRCETDLADTRRRGRAAQAVVLARLARRFSGRQGRPSAFPAGAELHRHSAAARRGARWLYSEFAGKLAGAPERSRTHPGLDGHTTKPANIRGRRQSRVGHFQRRSTRVSNYLVCKLCGRVDVTEGDYVGTKETMYCRDCADASSGGKATCCRRCCPTAHGTEKPKR